MAVLNILAFRHPAAHPVDGRPSDAGSSGHEIPDLLRRSRNCVDGLWCSAGRRNPASLPTWARPPLPPFATGALCFCRRPRNPAGGDRDHRRQRAVYCNRSSGRASCASSSLVRAPDRYGRARRIRLCQRQPQSVQQLLLAHGQARVSARIGDKACADIMLDAERTARLARRGLWADPNFAPLRSENIPRIEAARGQFALVEGKVLSVRESGRHTLFEFWATLDTRLYNHHCKASSAGIRR